MLISMLIEFSDVIILKTMKIWNCQYLSNEIKYEAEISYVQVAYDSYFGYGI